MPGLQEVAAERFDHLILSRLGNEKNVGKLPKLAQAQNVGKMLAKPSQDVGKEGDIEREPHRNRTCNLLIKSQLLCQLS